MTPETVLVELLERVGGGKNFIALITEYELNIWPDDAVAALKSQGLLVKARAASSAECPGCEEQCVMPVHTPPSATRGQGSFIVCDKPTLSCANRVKLPPDRLAQWRCSIKYVCQFIADQLEMRQPVKQTANPKLWNIGSVTGNKRSQMIGLRVENPLKLTAGNREAPLVELIEYRETAYVLNSKMILRLVDSSTAADPRYTSTTDRREMRKQETKAMHARWHDEYLKLKERHSNMSARWYSQQIAKNKSIAGGRKAETIRKNMKP